MKSTFQTEAQKLKEKLRAGEHYRPLTEDEYRELQRRASARLDEQEKAQVRLDYARIGIRESEVSMSWDLVQEGISDGMKALQAVKPAYERGFGIVFLWGSWGQAKTLIGRILTATALRAGRRPAYANVSDVLDDIRKGFEDKEHMTTELVRRMDWWISRDVLFLDEIDKCNDTPWAQDRMFKLLDQRYVRAIREEALTVIASNSSVASLDGYLQSRLKDHRLGPVVYLNGEDGRQLMPAGWAH